MEKSYIFLQINLLLCSVVCITACNNQNKSTWQENSGTESEPIAINRTPKGNDAPRVDSVLQFSSMFTCIFEDSKGNFWFGSHGDGVCRYDPSASLKSGGKQFTYFTAKQGLPSTRFHEFSERKVPMGNLIRTIQEDKSGNIWIRSADGFSKYDGQTFTTIYPEKESLLITESFEYSGNESEEDWKKELNHMWFGEAEKNGVYRYDGHKLTHLTFPTTQAYDNGSRSQYATYSLYKDKDGNIWFGTEGGGIMRYNGRSFTCINEKEEKGIVRSFFQDNTGKVWISNVLMGLYYYNHSAHQADRESLINFTREKGYYSLNDIRSNDLLDKSKMLDGIQTIEQDGKGNLWFGSYSDGLWHYDGKELTHYNEKNGLPGNTVKTIYKDKRGKLWFGIGKEQAHIYHFNGTSFDKFEGGREHE